LFAVLVLGHDRRQLLWFEVTRHPTAEWLARQITEAFPWASAPAYLVRDNDRAYGHAFRSRVRAMGIRDRPISPGSPWQNPYVERLIGTVRRECLDGMLVFGEAHLRQILSSYAAYYNEETPSQWTGGRNVDICRVPSAGRTKTGAGGTRRPESEATHYCCGSVAFSRQSTQKSRGDLRT